MEEYGRRMIEETRGERFKHIMRFVVEVCWLMGVAREEMHEWFLHSSVFTRQSRLRGWLPWITFLEWKGMEGTRAYQERGYPRCAGAVRLAAS